MRTRTYAGIGSRKSPEHLLPGFSSLAVELEKRGWMLRSGGAKGADKAFAKHIKTKQIFIPTDGFEGLYHNDNDVFSHIPDIAYDVAKKFHPKWNALSSFSKRLMARNSCQVLGLHCDDPADMIVCWTKDGEFVGGTSQALRIAKQYKVPIINFGHPYIAQMPIKKALITTLKYSDSLGRNNTWTEELFEK